MKHHNHTKNAAGISSLYDLCRTSGGSMALIENTVRRVAVSSGGAAINSGGIAVSSGEIAEISRAVREVWQSSGGSRALFEDGIRRRLGVMDGGRRFLAALSVIGVLQGMVPALAQTPGNNDGGEAIVVDADGNSSGGNPINTSSAVSNITLSGGGTYPADMGIYSGGMASNTIISAGGNQYVYSGGSAEMTSVYDGGTQNVYSDGRANATILFGGTQNVYSGGKNREIYISLSGTQNVFSGGFTDIVTIVSDGTQNVFSGGSAKEISISSGGTQNVFSGGFANSVIPRSGGNLNISAGGSAYVIQIEGGNINVHVIGGDTSTYVVGRNASNQEFSLMNGIASNFILYDKGYMHVSAGGSALDVTQHEGANVNVHIVGGDTSTYVSGTNASGDTFTLENGVASNFILYDEGTMHISAGGSAISTTISSGGSQVVSAGGTASATIVSSGGTLVGSGGTLAGDDNVIYDGGILSGDSLILDDDATLTQEVSAGNSVSQDISLQGSGSFIKTGDGTLTLTGAMGSADPAGSDDAFSYAGTITNDDDGTLAFNQSIEQTLVGVISGTGALEKDGTGKLILNHADNSAAAVNVSGGSLIVGGASIHSAASLSVTNAGGVNVYNGALLGGHGTIDANDVIIHSGGTLSPGNGSYGTTTISGKLSFSSGAYFDVQVDPASDPNNPRGDRTTVTDIATLAGTVRHISTGGMANDYLGKDWLILSALNNQLVNEFNSVESDLVFLLPQLRQEANEVFLFFTKISLNEPAQTRNEYAVADALESLNPDGSLYQEIVGNVTKDQARRILNELSGEIHASLKSHLFMQDTAFLRRLARHVGTRRSALGGVTTSRNDAHSNFWVSVNQGHNALDGDGNAGRSILTGTEIAGGHDANLENGWLGGLAFRLHDGRQEVNSRRSEADLMSYAAALYGGRELLLDSGTLRFLLSGALTRHDVESTRKILIGTRDQKVKADYSGLSWQGAFETAYRFSPTERLLLEPYASVALHSLRLDGFTEKGGNAALRKRKETWNHTVSLLGLRMTTPLTGRVTLDTDLAWKHVYGSILPKSVFTFREGSDRFAIVGPSLNRNAAIVGLGVGIKLTDTAKLGLSYDGELSGKGRSHAGKVLLEVRW